MTNSKIKLLVAVPSLECGGLERNVSIICNNIDTEKFDVTLCVLNNRNQFFGITNPAIKIIDLKINSVRKSLFAIAKLSREIKPGIILATANHLNLFFGIFKWLFPKRIKIIARESSIVSLNPPLKWDKKLYDWLMRRFYSKLDIIICQSLYMQEDLVKNYRVPAGKIKIIHNAIEHPSPVVSKNVYTASVVPKFITVARLSKEKGIDRIIRSLSLLTIPFQYTVIGEGELRPELEKLVKERSLETKVFMPGRSAQPFAEVKNPALFLMGSWFEGFPNVLLEANSMGIPVVAFNAPGGIGEVIINYENGILVEGNSEAEFASAINQALNFPFEHNNITRDIENRFAVKKILRKWEELLEGLID